MDIQDLIDLLWKPIVAIVLVVVDPARAVLGFVIGLVANPWWLVLPGAVLLAPVAELGYVFYWPGHEASFNSIIMGFFIALFAGWTGLAWTGRTPVLIGRRDTK